jgi:SAM-dependent methyltransferase
MQAALARIETAPVPDLPAEDAEAKRFWSTTDDQPHRHAGSPPHVLSLVELCLAAEARRILEFGCYSGRNLAALRDAYRAAGELDPELVGLDINARALEAGVEAGLDLRLGDETALAGFGDAAWDVAFTISVLDHMPDPWPALEQLARIIARRLILIEPHPLEGTGGKASVPAGEGARDEPMPFTYLHDYDALLIGLGLVQELDLPMPTHHHRVGPLYRLRSFTPAAGTQLARLLEAHPGPVLAYGLPGPVAARLGLPRAGSGQRLHLAGSPEGLGAALASAGPEETIIAPGRALGRLPGSSLASWQAEPVDGFLVRLRAGGAAAGPVPVATDSLRERLLTRILLQNREDASQVRVLEGRLRRLAEAPREKPAAAAPPPAPAAPAGPSAAARSVARLLIASRSQWMIGEVETLIAENRHQGEQWRRRLASQRVAAQIGASQHQSLVRQIVLLHALAARGKPARGWKSLRRSIARRFKALWARLPGPFRRHPARKRAALKT